MKSSARSRLRWSSTQHREDLRPHRGVEHRDRLVADQPVGLEHERRGDRDALALAAGELVRIAARGSARRSRPTSASARLHAVVVLGLRHPLDDERLGDDRRAPAGADSASGTGPGRSSARGGAARATLALPVDRRPVERDLAGRRADQAEHRARERGLAAAGLADDAEDLARAATRARRRRARAPRAAATLELRPPGRAPPSATSAHRRGAPRVSGAARPRATRSTGRSDRPRTARRATSRSGGSATAASRRVGAARAEAAALGHGTRDRAGRRGSAPRGRGRRRSPAASRAAASYTDAGGRRTRRSPGRSRRSAPRT